MRILKVAATAVLALALSAPAAGAFASPLESATPVPPVEDYSDLSVPDLPAGTPDYGISNEMLIDLAQTQTQEEIDRIVESDLSAVTLVDDSGNVIAAAATLEMGAIAARVEPATPLKNCLTNANNACIYTIGQTGGIPYRGTGTLNVNVVKATAVAAGDIKTVFHRAGAASVTVLPKKQTRFVTVSTVTKIVRQLV